jgi:hypothetical protein
VLIEVICETPGHACGASPSSRTAHRGCDPSPTAWPNIRNGSKRAIALRGRHGRCTSVTGPASRRPAYLGRTNSESRKRPPKSCHSHRKTSGPAINSRCEEGLILHTCEHITERYERRTSASGHFRGNDDVRDECGVPPIVTELVHGREREESDKRQRLSSLSLRTYKLAREKQSVQQRGREFIVVRAAGAMLTFGAKLRRVRVIRRVL